MKGLTDKPSYIIELLEGGVTLEDVIDGHICEQALVSSACRPLNTLWLQWIIFPNASNSCDDSVISNFFL